MSVTTTTRKSTYTGTGSTTAFATGFFFYKNADVVVKLKPSGGSDTTQTEGTHYTLSGAGNSAGGTVVFTSAPASGSTVTIERTVPLKQDIDFESQGQFDPAVHEEMGDRAVMGLQQLEARLVALESIANPAPTFTAGAGLVLASGVLDVGAGDGVTVSADAVAVAYGAVGLVKDVRTAPNSAGVSPLAARADHQHQGYTESPVDGSVLIGNVASEGAYSSLSRASHVHPVPAPGPPVNVTKAAASAGVSTNFCRQDHKHDIDTAAPSSIGAANAEGSATSLARSDHVHSAGALAEAVLAKSSIQTTNATSAEATNYLPPDGKVVHLEVYVIARKTDGTAGAAYKLQGTFRRGGATTTQIGVSSPPAVAQEDVAGWDAVFGLSGATVQVLVTGAADTIIDWTARGRVFIGP